MPLQRRSYHPCGCGRIPASHAQHTLDVGVVGLGRQSDRLVASDGDGVGLTGQSGLALQVDVLTLRLRLALSSSIRLHTVHKVVTALGVADVLHAEVHTLFNLAVADRLVHNHTDWRLVRSCSHTCTGENTVHHASAALVVLVWHTLLLARVSDNVHNVTGMERTEVTAHLHLTMLAELLGKHVPGARPVTITVRHLDESRC